MQSRTFITECRDKSSYMIEIYFEREKNHIMVNVFKGTIVRDTVDNLRITACEYE